MGGGGGGGGGKKMQERYPLRNVTGDWLPSVRQNTNRNQQNISPSSRSGKVSGRSPSGMDPRKMRKSWCDES